MVALGLGQEVGSLAFKVGTSLVSSAVVGKTVTPLKLSQELEDLRAPLDCSLCDTTLWGKRC